MQMTIDCFRWQGHFAHTFDNVDRIVVVNLHKVYDIFSFENLFFFNNNRCVLTDASGCDH